jgi:hypothetical protein
LWCVKYFSCVWAIDRWFKRDIFSMRRKYSIQCRKKDLFSRRYKLIFFLPRRVQKGGDSRGRESRMTFA